MSLKYGRVERVNLHTLKNMEKEEGRPVYLAEV